MNNILDILIEYSKKGRIVDYDFVTKVLSIVVPEKNLAEYVSKVSFEPVYEYTRKTDSLGAYKFYTQEIIMDNLLMIAVYHRIYENLGIYKCSDFEKSICSNGLLLQTLLHEVEHANQYSKSRMANLNFENLLLAICYHVHNQILDNMEIIEDEEFCLELRKDNKLKRRYSDSAPFERMADIVSMRELLMITKEIKDQIYGVYDSFHNMLLSYYLNGYGPRSCPSIKYLNSYRKLAITGSDIFFNQDYDLLLNKAQNDSLDSRLTLGLPITKNEYTNLRMKYEE